MCQQGVQKFTESFCYLWDAGFEGLHAECRGSQRHPRRVQRKAWALRQNMTGLESLCAISERAMYSIRRMNQSSRDPRWSKTPGTWYACWESSKQHTEPAWEWPRGLQPQLTEPGLPKLWGAPVLPQCVPNASCRADAQRSSAGFPCCFSVTLLAS